MWTIFARLEMKGIRRCADIAVEAGAEAGAEAEPEADVAVEAGAEVTPEAKPEAGGEPRMPINLSQRLGANNQM